MMKAILARVQQKHRTIGFPKAKPTLPDRFRGLPVLEAGHCSADCSACSEACPTSAIRREGEAPRIDLGRCLFCADCASACPSGALSFSGDHRLAVRRRQDLVLGPGEELDLAAALDRESRRVFGRSLKLRQVSAGGCNACESDLNVLGTVTYDLGRFGIQFVASPRHADGIVITGPVTANMELALKKTWEAIPEPRLVIAVGACAISGGPYINHHQACNGADGALPVDLYVPGCPPHPLTILDGLLRLLGRMPAGR